MKCFVNNGTLHGGTFIFILFHTSFPVSFYYVTCIEFVIYVKMLNYMNDSNYLLINDFYN